MVSVGVGGRGHVLRLVHREADGLRQAAGVLPSAGERQRAQTHPVGRLCKARVAGCYALAGAVGLAAGIWLGSTFVSPVLESSTAMYKRSDAFVRACEAAGGGGGRSRCAA